jgi:hypothetical protein
MINLRRQRRTSVGTFGSFDLIGFGGGAESKETETIGSESRMVRQHTEASLFITLHDELQRNGQIKALDVETVEAGDMVAVRTGPAVAPLRRVIDQIIRLLDLTLPLMGDEGPAPDLAEAGDMTRQQRRAGSSTC